MIRNQPSRIARSLAVAGFAMLGLVAAGCQCTAPMLTEADETALRSASREWERAANSRDNASIAALYTKDAVLLPAGGEAVRGQSAIRAWFDDLPPISEMKIEHVEVDGRGELAYVWGTYSMTLNPPGATAPIRDRGKYIEIWRREGDGSWKILRDIFNSDVLP